MPLRLLIGRAGTGKTTTCLREITQKISSAPQGAPLIWLVPEQSTYITEKALVSTPGIFGSTRAEVLSFGRLAYRLLQQIGENPQPVLEPIGRQMALAKIIHGRKKELIIFGRGAQKPGFAEALSDLLKEFAHYNIGPADLERMAKKTETKNLGQNLGRKLKDISLLYTDWIRFAAECGYLRPEENLNYILELLRKTDFLQETELWVDGFATFTPQELAVLKVLIQKAKRVTIALCYDPALYGEKYVSEDHVFYHIWQTGELLKKMACESGVEILAPLCLTEPQRWPEESALAWLEKQFTKRPHAAFTQKADNITLLAAADPRTEVMAVAREIERLCRKEHYRYRDITILARDLSLYEDVLRQVFSSLHIPIYLDEAHPLRLHPLVELVRSLLSIAAENWPAEAVWRYLKSGFIAVAKTDIDRLENYCLAAGINYGRWQETKDWIYVPRHWKNKGNEEDWQLALADVNQIRRDATQALYKTIPRLKKAVAAGEMIAVIKDHLAVLGVEETLQLWQQEAADAGDLLGASIHGQVYEAVNHLLGQAELLLADETLSVEELLSLLDAGFGALEISHIPLEVDMVFAADIEHSRNPAVKAAFVLGANEGVLPKKMEENGLLSAQERLLLEKSGLEIAPSAYRRQLQEEYLLYIILTRSAERLAISYTLADSGGKATFPSLLLGRLKELFPALQEHYEPAEPNGSEDLAILLPGFGNLAVLPGRLLAKQKGEEIPSFWLDVYDYYLQENEAGIGQILKGLAYRQPQQKLTAQTVSQLYGKQINGGVSRLEKFRQCPLLHFATYGLKLKKRPQYQPMAPDTGEFYHNALAMVGSILKEKQIDWAALSAEDCSILAKKITEQTLPDFWGDIAGNSGRYRYLAACLQQTLTAVLWAMTLQFQKGEFRPVAWEISFGPHEIIPALHMDLPDGGSLQLRGRIDRVDMAKGEENFWLRVVDYKSSKQTMTLNDAFYGLKMQLLAYLQIIMSNAASLGLSEPSKAAGMYYFTIQNPLVAATPDSGKEEIAASWFKEFRFNGMAIQDGAAVLKADAGIAGYSTILPVNMRVKKQVDKETGEVSEDYQFAANSQGLTAKELESLQNHLLTILEKTAGDILAGIAGANPVEQGNVKACSFCDYQSFCGFDRDLADPFCPPKLTAEEIWQKLGQEVQR